MTYNLDSAMVVVLRDAIKWESSVVTYAGTLSPVSDTTALNPLVYQRRDRELAFRDLITAAAIVETSVQVSDVWNAQVLRPALQGPVIRDLPVADTTQMSVVAGNASQVRQLQNSSIALDAARYADSDLYGRDCLIYETLAQMNQVFTTPRISRVDSHGTIFNSTGSYAWSLAEGAPYCADINAALPLGLATFKQPDQNLADRDNQLAGYTARLAAILKNPFEYANRLYVQVNGTVGGDSRESEVYSLQSATSTERIWICDPALSERNRFIYDVQDKTLRWVRESDTEVHQPQLVALSIPGIDTGQTLVTVPSVPDGKDCQYWRAKAGQLKPPGVQLIDSGSIRYTANPTYVSGGGLIQTDCASLTVPDAVQFNGLPTLPAGHYRVSLLVQPCPTVEILGNQNTEATSGTLGGASYGLIFNPAPATIPTNLQYLVVGGDGAVYGGVTYTAGQHFTANPTYTTYTYAGAVASTVNQYALDYSLALPPGSWTLEVVYTNLGSLTATTTTSFGIKAQIQAQGERAVDIIEDNIPLAFSGSHGQLVSTEPAHFEVPYLSAASVPPFNLPVYWTYGNGSLAIQRLTFRSSQVITQAGSYVLNATMGGQSASAYITAERLLPEVIRFDFTPTITTWGSFGLQWLNSASVYDQNKYVPLKIKQVQVQQVGTYSATALADEFQGWRQECLERAESIIQQNYAKAVTAYGTSVPTIRGTGSYWGDTQSENWMSFVETNNPRLREVLDIAKTGCLIAGHQYEVTAAPVTYNGTTWSNVGDRFYAYESSGSNYTGGSVKQIGAFVKSSAGHIGKPMLMPFGLYFTSAGTAAAYYDTAFSYPVIVTGVPWMIDAGLYVAQSEFWMPENI